MTQLEIQRALFDARNAYLKAKKEMEFHQREIAFLKQCERDLTQPSLYDQLFAN